MRGQNGGTVNVMTPTPRLAAASAGQLLELVRRRGGLSRQQLLAETGMSRGTLYGRLDALHRHGFVYEAESLGVTGGRRARRVRFDDRGRVLLTIDLGQTRARVSVTDLDGAEQRHDTLALPAADRAAAAVLDPVLARAERLLAGGGERLVGVGVGAPAAVDPGSGAIVRATRPGWSPDTVLDAVAARWPLPTVVENDARAAALGECRDAGETLVYVKVATGLGCGIVVGGEVLRGARGLAGDIGHVRVAPLDPAVPAPVCRCGRAGCLAAYSSGRALLQRVGGRGIRSIGALVAAAAAGDREVRAELIAAADVLGAALAATVTTVNPHRLVLGGALGVLPELVDRVRDRILATVDALAVPLVLGSVLGDAATARGLARLVVQLAFAPAAVDAVVADAAPRHGAGSTDPRP